MNVVLIHKSLGAATMLTSPGRQKPSYATAHTHTHNIYLYMHVCSCVSIFSIYIYIYIYMHFSLIGNIYNFDNKCTYLTDH